MTRLRDDSQRQVTICYCINHGELEYPWDQAMIEFHQRMLAKPIDGLDEFGKQKKEGHDDYNPPSEGWRVEQRTRLGTDDEKRRKAFEFYEKASPEQREKLLSTCNPGQRAMILECIEEMRRQCKGCGE